MTVIWHFFAKYLFIFLEKKARQFLNLNFPEFQEFRNEYIYIYMQNTSCVVHFVIVTQCGFQFSNNFNKISIKYFFFFSGLDLFANYFVPNISHSLQHII
jgi:hypothetical protein